MWQRWVRTSLAAVMGLYSGDNRAGWLSLPVGRNRRHRRHQQGRLRHGARRRGRGGYRRTYVSFSVRAGIRGDTGHADRGDALLHAEALGFADRSATGRETRKSRVGSQAGNRAASHVGGRSRVPLWQGGRGYRITTNRFPGRAQAPRPPRSRRRDAESDEAE